VFEADGEGLHMKVREFPLKSVFPVVKPPEHVEKGTPGFDGDSSGLIKDGRPGKYLHGKKGFLLAMAGLALCFSLPLYRLARFAAESDLHSYILMMPLVSLYLVWLKRESLLVQSEPVRRWGTIFLAGGLVLLAAYWLVDRQGVKLTTEDSLAFTIFSLFLMVLGVCGLFLGRETVRSLAFPIGLLVFMVPFPTVVTQHIEAFLQQGSAVAAEGLFSLSGTIYSRDGMLFLLPGIRIQVAPECSGIHSSIVLFIVSLLAGYLFLRSPGKRAVLALAMVPLALLRNGFRIFTIGQLCVHLGPQMIDSPIHHRGGPLFFALSLIPFLLLLVLLQKADRKRAGSKPGADAPAHG
jgi:exosortase C (VPDSG-CTERM-specific)